MSVRTFVHSHFGRHVAWLLAMVVVAAPPLTVSAGNLGFRNNAVGGVKVDAEGMLGNYDPQSRKVVLQQLRDELKKPGAELSAATEMRLVSLRGLEAAVAASPDKLPDEVRYLAGLQRIQYVFIYPEQNDIVLAGPGEGWKVRDDAVVVGVTTERPVLLFDDLLVALRAAKDAHRNTISCSIDPTDEGRKNLEAVLAKQSTFNQGIPSLIERAMGPQKISITGVPADSHLARVLVAADYRMKRIAMHLDPTPLKSLPSFLEMLQAARVKPDNMMPRWWLACKYEPLARSEDSLAWELRGPGVQCLTEDEFIAEDGAVKGTGKANPVAAKWAKAMTDQYDDLSKKDAIFGELRNVMDMCVIATLIHKEGLLEKANLQLPNLLGSDSTVTYEAYAAPKHVPTQSSFLKVGRDYIITASGGVEITSWEVASNTKVEPAIKDLYNRRSAPTENWYAN